MVEFIVICARSEEIRIDHRLVVTRPLGKTVTLGLANLHLDVVDCMHVIPHIDIQTDTFAPVTRLHRLFRFEVVDVADLDVQNALEHLLADAFAAHNQLEHIVVANGQFFPRLHPIGAHAITSFFYFTVFSRAKQVKECAAASNLAADDDSG